VRIGIARDEAFGFYYPDDLEALETAGATLVPIDMLRDTSLPLLDGLFIGGGFPEAFLPQLEANAALRGAIRAAIGAGLPTYAECGGLMFLARSIRWKDRVAAMVGAIGADVVMRDRPVGRGYVRLAPTADHPWPMHAADAPCLGHEFHHSELVDADPGLRYAYTVQRGHGIDGRRDGVIVNNLLASYAHLRGTGGNDWPARFVAFVRQVSEPAAREARLAPPQPHPGLVPCSA
jgi:cobyrinic acid a,c-diamide synthase